jgi:organic hydroperoxide reductase OsmC/OhrA
MSEHHASLHWTRRSPDFTPDTYNRSHEVRFKNGSIVVPGDIAREFKGEGSGVDPEENFVSALSACHMLTFLAVAARKHLSVDAYDDEATGYLERNEHGRIAVTRVVLRPHVRFTPGTSVETKVLDDLHRVAHAGCFIANSVKTAVAIEPRP